MANGNDTLSILLGDGAGNFTLVSSPEMGQLPDSIAVGDFNGDGMLDLAVCNVNSFDVSLLLGDGTGHFTVASSPLVSGGYGPFSVAVGDFNSDGKLDLAVLTTHLDILLQAPAVTLSPASLVYTGQMVGTTSASQTVKITNVGYAAVDIQGVIIGGIDPDDFSQTNTCPTNLAVGESCTIKIKFSPVNGGTRSAVMSLAGDIGSNPSSVSLSGYGLSLTLNPKTLDFGDVMVGQMSQPMESTLTNIGPTTADLFDFKLTDETDFSYTTTCGSSLPPGKNCTLTVTFRPKQSGQINGAININNDIVGLQKLKLTGNGT